jgi:NADH:ubiquinone reductase (H+-translocating)
MVQRILVLGGGFAGLWSAAAATRVLDQAGVGPDRIEVSLINRDAWHCIRVRNYEADLTDTRVALDDVLRPIGVARIEAEIAGIDVAARQVFCSAGGQTRSVPWDRLVIALGSQLVRPPIPGLAAFGLDVDTYGTGQRLNAHIAALTGLPASPGQFTAVVVGAGLTGIEVAAEMHGKLRAAIEASGRFGRSRVVLVDRAARIGASLGAEPPAVIQTALTAMAVETRPGETVACVDGGGVELSSGERIEAATVVWCGGMRASPVLASVPAEHDALGRLMVEPTMQVRGLPGVFAAGDAACAVVDGIHASVMSCQHARPMGRFAGHNAAADLLGQALLDLRIERYVTVMDLGPWGAMYTEGWDRHVVTTGAAAKQTKETINRLRIYPPRSGGRQAILDAAAATVQAPPAR